MELVLRLIDRLYVDIPVTCLLFVLLRSISHLGIQIVAHLPCSDSHRACVCVLSLLSSSNYLPSLSDCVSTLVFARDCALTLHFSS